MRIETATGRAVIAALAAAVLCATAALGPGAQAHDGGDGKDGEGPNFHRQEIDPDLILDSPFEELELACIEDKNGAACLEAGRRWRDGRGIDKADLIQAINILRAGCSFDSAEACYEAGELYLSGKSGVQIIVPSGAFSLDFGSAEEMFRAACDLGLLSACGIWGDLLVNPDAMLPRPDWQHRNLRPDILLGRQAYEDGCQALPEGHDDLDLPDVMGGDLDDGDDHDHGDGDDHEHPHTRDHSHRAPWPSADARSCLRLGQGLERGALGSRKDPERALVYYDRACELGMQAGCERSEVLAMELELDEDPSEGVVVNPEVEGSIRRSVQPYRPNPDVARFNDQTTGITGAVKGTTHSTRIDIELGVGARWTYAGPQSFTGWKWRGGLNLWFNLVGIGLETAFTTDKLFQPTSRLYRRYFHSLSGKFVIPLPIRMPIPARIQIVVGAGAGIGSLKLADADFALMGGIREIVQLVLVAGQDRGPRQWGALRIEQQQSFGGGLLAVEHSTQFTFIFGFTAGGWGPSFKKRSLDSN